MKKPSQPDRTKGEPAILLPLPESVAAWMAFVRPQAPELDETFQRIARLHAKQPEHVTAWLRTFKARVAEIAPQMIKAEADKTFHWIDEQHAAHPGAMSDLFIQEYKASNKEDIELEQTLIAEGRVFREEFSRLTSGDPRTTGNMLPLFQYFYTQRLCPAWLIGFSDDTALKQQWEQQMRAQRLERMRAIARGDRPKAKGKSKWSPEVHQAAQDFYSAAMEQYRNDSARFWRWKDFAPKCVEAVKERTGTVVTEDQLKRYILPAKKYPRPK